MSEQRLMQQTSSPRTRESLAHDLCALGVEAGMTLEVHSSLSTLGWVCGGPVALVQALLDVATETGTLLMPTHTPNYTDPAKWSNPPVPQEWWSALYEQMPAFDPRLTPSWFMGQVAETFRTWPGVLRYDVRGWGDSAQEEAEPPFSPRQDLLSLLHYLNIEKTYLLGLSGGGTLALDFTLEHPDKVDALILVSSDPSGYAPPMTDAIQTFAARYYGALQQKDIAGAVEATVRFWTDGPRRTPEQVDAQARARVATLSRQQIERHGDFMAHEPHMIPLEPPAINRLAEVRVPTLIVVGDEDVPQVIEAADILEQGIAGAQKVAIAGTAHHPQMEKPEEFNRVVLDFLKSLSR